MKIGILRADTVRPHLAEEYGEYPDMFMSLLSAQDGAVSYVVYDVEHEQYPADIHEVDAYLLTGSKSSVYDDDPWILRLTDFVRTLDAQRKKLVGICFGHQMVAHALGGEVTRSPRGWGVGVHDYTMSQLPDWHDGGEAQFQLLASHQDQVVTPAADAQVLGGSDFCESAVCQVGDHILTFQGHPEFVPGYSAALMDIRRDTIGEDTYVAARASLDRDPQSERVARWILGFLRS